MAKETKQPATANSEAAAPESNRQQNPAPLCPYCSTEDKPVKCKSNRSEPLWTWYYCPNDDCTGGVNGFSIKQLRPAGERTRMKDEQQGFSAR